MATTTPNFGWTVPTSTDLVKDGATAIETLGDSIDASFVDLKGGTTGQVLSKASGTDLDFSWVAQDDSNAIQNAIVDAKGDLIAATAADTPARLAVGTNGQFLVADSTAATGLAWTTVSNSAGMVLVTTSAFSASTSHSVNNCFSTTYTNYLLIVDMDSTADDALLMRLRVSGSDNATAGNYKWASQYTDYAGGTGTGNGGGSATSWNMGNILSTSRTSTIIDVCNPFTAEQASFQGVSAGGLGALYRGGLMTVTTSYTGFTLIPGSGNITGTVSVYGYAK
jgi:hypothetical protein